MKVVIDTNIIVSGLLTPFGSPSEILRLLALGKLIICFDTRIMAEYLGVLNRPKFSDGCKSRLASMLKLAK